MGWSLVQQRRLQAEREILSKYFPSFKWISPNDNNNTKVEGNVPSNLGNNYTLRIYVPSDFPNSRPDMVVTSPYPLRGFLGQDLIHYGANSKMHTLKPRDGFVKICHHKDWQPNLTLYLVILKGRIWLEALEAHKRSGKYIADFLCEMQ
jgi:hypothetical protein